MSEGRIILVRHGETDWNKKRYLGWGDVPLNGIGLAQAQAVADRLADRRVDAIYCSPLVRAVETIRPFLERRGLEMTLSEDLKELHYGEWQGAPKKSGPKLADAHRHLPLPGGESLFDLYRRARRFLEGAAVSLETGSHLVWVGHFWINRMLLGAIRNDPFSAVIDRMEYRPDNASLLEIRYLFEPGEGIRIVSCSWIGSL